MSAGDNAEIINAFEQTPVGVSAPEIDAAMDDVALVMGLRGHDKCVAAFWKAIGYPLDTCRNASTAF